MLADWCVSGSHQGNLLNRSPNSRARGASCSKGQRDDHFDVLDVPSRLPQVCSYGIPEEPRTSCQTADGKFLHTVPHTLSASDCVAGRSKTAPLFIPSTSLPSAGLKITAWAASCVLAGL